MIVCGLVTPQKNWLIIDGEALGTWEQEPGEESQHK
jgi:hypothetical protein